MNLRARISDRSGRRFFRRRWKTEVRSNTDRPVQFSLRLFAAHPVTATGMGNPDAVDHSKLPTPFGSASDTRSASSAFAARWSPRNFGSQASLQFFVRFVSHNIAPHVCPTGPTTRCKTSPPNSPLATGSRRSIGKRLPRSASSCSSSTSPCNCWEPCSARRLNSSIC